MINWSRFQSYGQAMASWQWIVFILSIAAAVWLIFRVRAYFREDAEDSDQTLEMLTQFRDLHQEGGLSDDEFRLIRSRLIRTGQVTLAAGKGKPSAIPADLEPLDSGRVEPANSNETTEETTSSRMTDEETE